MVLSLETLILLLVTMFRYAKIQRRAFAKQQVAICMHWESYYAAIWANDQAEYVNPFFPYLGYWRGNESAINSFRHFARFMNPEFNPRFPSSIIMKDCRLSRQVPETEVMLHYCFVAPHFSLTYADKAVAQELWPLIEWCLGCTMANPLPRSNVRCRWGREGHLKTGDTKSLYFITVNALLSAASLSKELGLPSSVATTYHVGLQHLKVNIEKYYGATVSGFDTYRYYDGNDILRSWICIPLTVGIFDRAEATVDALCSPLLWEKDGLLTAQGSTTFWDRSTLYALRGIYAWEWLILLLKS